MSEILFEYIQQGNLIKITAIDPDSKTEAVVVVPLGLSELQMQQLALAKLNYILSRQNNKDCG